MGDNETGGLHNASDGGVAGKHPEADPFELLVAPSTSSELNTAALRLIPIACWRVDDIRFAFDSSFVTSDVATELNMLASLREANKQTDATSQKTNYPPLSVFGHADPIGTDDYNKGLSGRRATVVYALLISKSDSATAVQLWQEVAQQENWGAKQRQAMQDFTSLPAGTSDSELFKAYMQKLYPADLNLTKKDFLAQGADGNGKGDYQGCSEFNPVLIFSTQKNNAFESQKDKTARNDANSPNRRVIVLLFRPGSQVIASKWPCPRANEGTAGCIKRFWSDGQQRRSKRLADQDRKFDDQKDTFACRFYQRLTTNSPCEAALTLVKIRLFDPQGRPLPFAPCLITEPGKQPRGDRATGVPPSPPGTTPAAAAGSSAGGDKEDAVIMLRIQKPPATVNVKWSRPKAVEAQGAAPPKPEDPYDFEYEMDVAIDVPETDATQATRTRLKNLGYEVNPPIAIPGLGDPVQAFQRDYKPKFGDIVVDGTLNDPTINAAKTAHDAADPVLRAGSDIAVKR